MTNGVPAMYTSSESKEKKGEKVIPQTYQEPFLSKVDKASLAAITSFSSELGVGSSAVSVRLRKRKRSLLVSVIIVHPTQVRKPKRKIKCIAVVVQGATVGVGRVGAAALLLLAVSADDSKMAPDLLRICKISNSNSMVPDEYIIDNFLISYRSHAVYFSWNKKAAAWLEGGSAGVDTIATPLSIATLIIPLCVFIGAC